MSEDASARPGWYPQPGGLDRWWNGASWSDAMRPTPSASGEAGFAAPSSSGQSSQPSQPGEPAYGQTPHAQAGYQHAGYQPAGYRQSGYQPGQGYYSPPQSSSHTLRNVLLGVGLVLVLLVGGCAAVIAVAATKVHTSVDRAVNDKTPGGVNVPLTITEGQAFSVRDLDYAAGWSIGTDEFGEVTVANLSVTNSGDSAKSDFVYVDLRSGGAKVARVDCYADSGRLAPGDSQLLSCFSSDKRPATYDQVTIRDQYAF